MCLHKTARARAHVHVGHVVCCHPRRGDTHGARKKNLSRFGHQNPEKFNFENLVFYRKNGKKGSFFKVFLKFFHKTARAHGACGLKIWNVE